MKRLLLIAIALGIIFTLIGPGAPRLLLQKDDANGEESEQMVFMTKLEPTNGFSSGAGSDGRDTTGSGVCFQPQEGGAPVKPIYFTSVGPNPPRFLLTDLNPVTPIMFEESGFTPVKPIYFIHLGPGAAIDPIYFGMDTGTKMDGQGLFFREIGDPMKDVELVSFSEDKGPMKQPEGHAKMLIEDSADETHFFGVNMGGVKWADKIGF